MAKVRLLWRNKADTATVSASSASYGNAAANVQDPHRYTMWQTEDDTAAEWIQFDLSQAESIQALVIDNHDFSDSDTITIQANATDSWTSPSVDLELTVTDTTIVYHWASAQSYRYWRLAVTKAASVYQRQVGRVYLGPYYECPRNPRRDGWSHGPVDQSAIRRSPYGPVWSDVRGQYHRVEMRFEYASQAQADEFALLAATLGTHSPWWLSADHDAEPLDWLWYGRLTDLRGAEHRTYDGSGHLWDLRLEMETEP